MISLMSHSHKSQEMRSYRGIINKVLRCVEKRFILYKQKPCEINIGRYRIVISRLLKFYLNMRFITGVYAVLTYLTSYLCKPEHTVSSVEIKKKIVL